MLLAIDVGNTQTVLGLFDGDRLAETWRLATEPRRTGDELGLTLGGLVLSVLATKSGVRLPVGSAVAVSWSPSDALVLGAGPAVAGSSEHEEEQP